MPITTILFDAGGTLVFPSFARIAHELGAHGVVADPADLARADARVRFEIDRPDVIAATTDGGRFRRYLDALAGAAGLERMPEPVFERLDAYHRLHNLWEDVPPDVPAALERLRGRVRMGVVSNANGTVRAKLARVGLAGYFELIVDSHEEEIEKPDPRIRRLHGLTSSSLVSGTTRDHYLIGGFDSFAPSTSTTTTSCST